MRGGVFLAQTGGLGGYPTDVLSNDGEAMSCVSVSIERFQKDKAVTVSVDRGRWAAQALESHGAGKLGLSSEHLHAVRRKGFKCSAWIGIRLRCRAAPRLKIH